MPDPVLARALAARVLWCPVCRGLRGGVYHDSPVELAEVFEEEAGVVVMGALRCLACPARFPIVDGVAILLRDLAAWTRREERSLLGRDDLPGPLRDAFLLAWSDDEDPGWRREMLAIYARDPDPAAPPAPDDAPDGLAAALAAAAREGRAYLAARRRALAADLAPGAWAADLGCGVGASSLDLAAAGAGAGLGVLALDAAFAPLRALALLLRRGVIDVPRWRHGGDDFPSARVVREDARGAPVLPVVGDALDPPLGAGRLELVTAYGLLDNVANPVVLVRQAAAALRRPGGRLALSTPFDWVSRCTPREERLLEPDPAAALDRLLAGGEPERAPGLRLALEHARDDVPWVLRRHRRSAHAFLCRYVEARALGPDEPAAGPDAPAP